MDFIKEQWAKLISVQESPEIWMIVLSFALAFLLTATPLWRITRNAITVVHEGGHALMAVLWGRRVSGIKLHSDTSGVTFSSGKAWGLGVIFTTAAGYPAPAFLGLGIAYLSSQGYIYLATVLIGILMLLIFLSIRNFWGLIVTAPLTLAFYYILQAAPVAQSFILTFIGIFMTVASTRPIIELQKSRWRSEAEDSDADQLQKLTFIIPGLFWVVLFLLISIGANALTLWFYLEPHLSG